jgi:hypothetical protein
VPCEAPAVPLMAFPLSGMAETDRAARWTVAVLFPRDGQVELQAPPGPVR